MLRDLSDNNNESSDIFFFYQEGGFYQMHVRVRDSIYVKFMLDAYKRARSPAPARHGKGEGWPILHEAHKAAADYYERLFVHSNSLPPLFEAVYHRIAAHRIQSLTSPGNWKALVGQQPAEDLLRDLLRTLYALLGRASEVHSTDRRRRSWRG